MHRLFRQRVKSAIFFIWILFPSALLLAQEASQICTYTDAGGVIRQVKGRENVPEEFQENASCFVARPTKPSNTKAQSASHQPSSPDGIICMYQGSDGRLYQVEGPDAVPQQYRKHSRCISKTARSMAEPGDVDLDGSLRKERMVSPLGLIHLRWPRSVERLFGRTPQRAVADAAGAVSRAVKQSSLSTQLGAWEPEWDIVFMDAQVPETQIPASLVSNCHPGWMIPPAKIYIVGQRVAAGCGGSNPSSSSVADSQLAEVLIHEMGHAVDYALRPNNFGANRAMIEGFATWFTAYASDYSSEISGGTVGRRQLLIARESVAKNPGNLHFRGTGEDYARASLYYHALVDRKGVKGLMRVYEYMNENRVDFFAAADKAMYWDQKKFEKEIQRVLK